jgi:hypothetical protein
VAPTKAAMLPSPSNRKWRPAQMTASAAEILLSSRVDLVSLLLEREEGTLDHFLRLRVLVDTIEREKSQNLPAFHSMQDFSP